jgi:hypothetical protein
LARFSRQSIVIGLTRCSLAVAGLRVDYLRTKELQMAEGVDLRISFVDQSGPAPTGSQAGSFRPQAAVLGLDCCVFADPGVVADVEDSPPANGRWRPAKKERRPIAKK